MSETTTLCDLCGQDIPPRFCVTCGADISDLRADATVCSRGCYWRSRAVMARARARKRTFLSTEEGRAKQKGWAETTRARKQ